MFGKLGFSFEVDMGNSTKKLAEGSKMLQSVGRAGKSSGESFGAFQKKARKLNNTFTNLNRDGNRTTKVFKGMGSSLFSLGNIIKGVGLWKLSGVLSQSITSAMDMIETTHLFEVSMGNLAEETDVVIQKMHELTGLDVANLRNRIGTMNLLGQTMGMTAKNAQTLALNTNQLSLDMGALFNVPYQQITEDLRSGLIGQSRTLYKYGIDVTEAAIANEALAQGITKSVRHMSQGEKMMLRHNVIVRQMTKMQGDFAITFNQPINQLRILKERFATLSRTIGQLFVPVMGVVLKVANAVTIVLTRMIRALGAFFGIDMDNNVKNMGDSFGGINEDIDDGMDSLGGGLGSANKQAKKLKKQLAGFDELNIIQTKIPNSASGGSGGSAGGGVGGGSPLDLDLGLYDSMIEGIEDKAMNLANKMIDKMRPFLTWVKNNFDEILLLVKNVGIALLGWKVSKTILSIFEKLGLISKGQVFTIALGVTLTVSGITLAAQNIKAILGDKWDNTSLTSAINNLLSGLLIGSGVKLTLGAMGVTVGWWTIPISVILSMSVTSIATNWEEAKKTASGWWDILVGVFTRDDEKKKEGSTKIFEAFLDADLWSKKLYDWSQDALEKFWDAVFEKIGENIDKLKKTVAKKWAEVTENVKGKVVEFKGKVATKWNDIRKKWTDVTDNIKDKTADFKAKVATKWSELKGTWRNLTSNVKDKTADFKGRVVTKWNNIKSSWNNVTKNIKNKTADFKGRVTTTWSSIQTSWNNVTKNIKDKTVNFKGRVATTWSSLRGTWTRLTNNFKDKNVDFRVRLSTTVGSVKNFVNQLISSINRNLIAKLDFSFRVPAWLGGGRWSWRAPRIPMLADGGMLNAGQMFIAREAGAELVGSYGNKTAVMNNDDIVASVSRGVYQAVKSAMGSIGGNDSPTHIIVKVGEDTLVDRIISGTNRKSVIDGMTVINV